MKQLNIKDISFEREHTEAPTVQGEQIVSQCPQGHDTAYQSPNKEGNYFFPCIQYDPASNREACKSQQHDTWQKCVFCLDAIDPNDSDRDINVRPQRPENFIRIFKNELLPIESFTPFLPDNEMDKRCFQQIYDLVQKNQGNEYFAKSSVLRELNEIIVNQNCDHIDFSQFLQNIYVAVTLPSLDGLPLNGVAPRDMSDEDLNALMSQYAEIMHKWWKVRNATRNNRSDTNKNGIVDVQQLWIDSLPTVAGRPAFMSMISASPQEKLFDEEYKKLEEK